MVSETTGLISYCQQDPVSQMINGNVASTNRICPISTPLLKENRDMPIRARRIRQSTTSRFAEKIWSRLLVLYRKALA
jgi:hypothetical protein